MRGAFLKHPVLALFLSGEFLLHITCLLFISVGSLSYISWVGSLSLPFPLSFLGWLHFYAESFSYTSRAGFFWGVGGGGGGGLSCASSAGFIFLWWVFLTPPIFVWFFCGEFLLHIPCWLCFIYLGSFSYTSRAGFIFNWGISLPHPERASYLISWVSPTQPVMALFLSGKFLLHIPCWLYLSVGSFSYTSHAGSFFFFFFF